MQDEAHTLWEEPLYRFILQLTIAEIGMLALIMLGVIFIRQARILAERRRDKVAKALFDPLMRYLAGDVSLDDTYEFLRRFPRRIVCLEFEKYVMMLDGRALSRIRALYARLDLRILGMKLAHSAYWWRRLEGVRLLGATAGDDVVDILMDAVRDRSPVVRLAAVRSLGRIRSIKSIRPLLDMLSEAENMSRRQLAQTLVAFGTDVQPFLKRILVEVLDKDGNPHFLATVLEVLALTGDVDCKGEVLLAMESDKLEVRIAAYKAATLLHLPLATKTLLNGIHDSDWQVRAQAALAAGKMKDTRVIPELGACLSDRSWWVRNNAGAGLFNCGRKGVAELYRIAAESEDRFARDMAMRTLTADPLYFEMNNERLPKETTEEPLA